jgi:hypothetical protein
MAFSYYIRNSAIILKVQIMNYESKKILLIFIGASLFGGLTGLFNLLYGPVVVSVLVAYIAITICWKDLLFIIIKFLSGFIFPTRG